MADPSIEGVISEIRILDHKFRRSCDHINLLNNRIDAMQSRFDCASADSQRTFCYNIRLRLATLEGVRNMFQEYATRVADKLDSLQRMPMEAHITNTSLKTSPMIRTNTLMTKAPKVTKREMCKTNESSQSQP